MSSGRASSVLLVALLVAACATGGAQLPSAADATRIELTIFGAASLTGVLEEAVARYERANPATGIVLSTGSSAALATQIAEGAPADVFLSADTANPERLVDAGLALGAPVTFASNELVIVVAPGNPAGLSSPADLARPGVKVIAAGDAVPITSYATQVVANLARDAGDPAAFAAAYEANVVSKEEDVKAVVAKVELGEGDAAIVYATDATASDTVSTIAIPDAANVAATYQGIVIGASGHSDEAASFLDWFAGPEGRAILSAFGFLAPSS